MKPLKLTVTLLLTLFSAYLLSFFVGLIPYLLIDFFPLGAFAVGLYVCLLVAALIILFTDKLPWWKQNLVKINLTVLFISIPIAMIIPSNATIVNRPKVLELKGHLIQTETVLKSLPQPYPGNAAALKQHLDPSIKIEDFATYQAAESHQKYAYRGTVLYQAPTETSHYQLYGVSHSAGLLRWPE